METKLKEFERYASRGAVVALLAILAIFLFATAANAASSAPIIVSQSTWFTAYPNGGALAGDVPAGGSWGINSMGVIVASETYGGNIIQFSGPGYAVSVVGPFANAGAVAIDSNNFLYVAGQFTNVVAKIPMNTNGTYTYTVDPSGSGGSALPACTGVAATDKTAGECIIKSLGSSTLGYFGVESMTFDAANDLFFATDDQGDSGGVGPAYSIFECKAAGTKCLYPASGSTAAPVLIYAEPIASTPGTTGQLYVGGMSIDPWGNLFFTDSALANTSNKSIDSHLNEMLVDTTANSGFNGVTTGFTAAPTVVETLTIASPGNYDDQIDAVYADPTPSDGKVYIGLDNSGIYGIPNSKTGATAAGIYAISNQGTKLLQKDTYGNFYVEGYSTVVNTSGADTVGYVSLDGPSFPGTATTATVLVADNSDPCSTAVLTFTVPDPPFAASAGTCGSSSLGTAAEFPVTVTYTPTTGVTPYTGFTVNDTASGDSSSVIAKAGSISSVSQNTWGAAFTGGGVFGADASDSGTMALNSTLGAVLAGSSYGNDLQQFTSTGTVVANLGPLNGVGAVAIDSSGYAYAGNEYGNTIIKLPVISGAYPTFTAAQVTAAPTCKGDGVAPDNAGICQIVVGNGTIAFGIAGINFDKNGNLFITTSDESPSTTVTNQPYSILECGPTCLYGATPTAPILLYAETVPSDAASDQYYVGAISIDSNDNVFFTDSLIDVGGSSYSHSSDLQELKTSTSAGFNGVTTGYAAAPTLLETETPVCTAAPCKYNNEIDAVSIDSKNNVYFADQYTGIYEILNNSGTLEWANPIALAAPGAKVIASDTKGNFYYAGYNNGSDTMAFNAIGSVTVLGQASSAAPTTATNVWVLDDFGCTNPPVLTITSGDTEFTGALTAPAGCDALTFGGGSSLPTTITFTPTASASGAVSSTLTVDDTVNGSTGSGFAVSGSAATAQAITDFAGITSPVVFGGGPYTLSATGGASGNPVVFSVDAGSTAGVGAVSGTNGTTLTITGAGTLIIDANQAGTTTGTPIYAAAPQVQITIDVTQAPQTITFKPTSPVSYSTTPITLSASGGGSGNPVTFSLTSGPGTLSGTNNATLTITGVGTIMIAASQAGNANYLAAGAVTGTIVVNQAAQTITFNPTTPLGYGKAETLSATGGASGNPVTFTLDASSTAGAGSLSGSTLTATGLGTIVVDANQAGNADYAAATQVMGSVAVTPLGQVATPVISPATGSTLIIGTSNTATITDSTSGAAILYTTDGSNPLTSSTAKTYAGAITLTAETYPATVTVTAVATLAGYTPSASGASTYTLQVIPPDFTIGAQPSVTVGPGSSATVTITIVPNPAFTVPITFTSSGAPSGVTFVFNPATITPPGTTSTILTITDSNTASLQHRSNPFLPAGATFAIALCFFGWKKRRGLMLALVLIAGVIGAIQLSGCGAYNGPPAPPKGTNTVVTITATGGGVTQTVPISVFVEQ